MSESVFVRVPVFVVEQPIGTFYVGVMDAVDLYVTSYADARRLQEGSEDTYLGIQRQVSEKRLKELKAYIENSDATFPTGVILAASSQDVEFDGTDLVFTRSSETFRILDGQHRIVAFEDRFKAEKRGFMMPVMVYIDLDIEDQAQVFATINLAQTKVNKSLAYDLYNFETRPSPQRTAHQIARLLNRSERSPYKGLVKVLGTGVRGDEVLTQAAIVDQILPLISSKPGRDRNLVRLGRWPADNDEAAGPKTVFRAMWTKSQDDQIGITILRYFIAVKERWPEAWDNREQGVMIAKTNGFIAFMTHLREFMQRRKGQASLAPEIEEFKADLAKVPLNDGDFNTDRYKPGTTGQSALADDLRKSFLTTTSSDSTPPTAPS